jgi:hypothetical protein
MHQLQGDSGGVGQLGHIVATSRGHGHAELWADAGTPRKYRVPHGSDQAGGRSHASRLLKMGVQGLLSACQQTHGTSERKTRLSKLTGMSVNIVLFQ